MCQDGQASQEVMKRCSLITTDLGDHLLDSGCVRKGTLVLVAGVDSPNAAAGDITLLGPTAGDETRLSPPAEAKAPLSSLGGDRTPLSPPVNGGKVGGGEVDNCERAWSDHRTTGKGTPQTPSPLTGRAGEGSYSSSAGRAGEGSYSSSAGRAGEGSYSSSAGRAEEGSYSPSAGRAGEGGPPEERVETRACPMPGSALATFSFPTFRPIESIRSGDEVFGHDSVFHRVRRIVSRNYSGPMIGIRTAASRTTLWMTADHYVLCARREVYYGGDRSWKHIHPTNFQRAKDMRKEMTATERMLWKRLRGSAIGLAFRRQHPIGPYIVDFYCRDAGLVVEVDGDSHFTPEGNASDSKRTSYLEGLGLNVLRFTNEQVRREMAGLLEVLAHAAASVKRADDHREQWRRADSLRVGDIVFMADRSCTSGRPDRPKCLSRSPLRQDNMCPEANPLPVNGEGRGGVLRPVPIAVIERSTTEETVYNLEVDVCHSFLTEVCAVRNCCSGGSWATPK